MKELAMETEHLRKVRDSFLISCYTGLRYSDYSRLTYENLNFDKGIIRVRTKKTGELVVIPFMPEVQDILEYHKDKHLPAFANQVMNKSLKEIGKKMSEKVKELKMIGQNEKKDYSQLSTHTGRRSFCSNMYYRGIDVEMIMAISGHRTEKQFRNYIKVKNEDKAARFFSQAQERKQIVNIRMVK